MMRYFNLEQSGEKSNAAIQFPDSYVGPIQSKQHLTTHDMMIQVSTNVSCN